MSAKMTKEEKVELFKSLVADSDAQKAREQLCSELAEAICKAGEILYVGGWVLKNRSIEGLGVLTQLTGELATGAVSLLRIEKYYAAAC